MKNILHMSATGLANRPIKKCLLSKRISESKLTPPDVSKPTCITVIQQQPVPVALRVFYNNNENLKMLQVGPMAKETIPKPYTKLINHPKGQNTHQFLPAFGEMWQCQDSPIDNGPQRQDLSIKVWILNWCNKIRVFLKFGQKTINICWYTA